MSLGTDVAVSWAMNLTTSLARERTQVLVVGAGPVGLLAALRLRQRGVSVRLVDQQPEHRAHTFPVVFHPQSLRLLAELGVTAAMYWRGRPVTRLAIATERERRAVLELPRVRELGAGALTLPQDTLRQALVNALLDLGVTVEYDTRLDVLQQDESGVWGRLQHERPAQMLLGSRRAEVRAFQADFVVGADGYESTVRASLGIQLEDHGRLESFAFFDATTSSSAKEALLALAQGTASSVYPLQGGQARFSFQLSRSLHQAPDLGTLRQLIASRLPWFEGEIISCDWAGVAEFRCALASSFGRGRIWLAGEAAHLTGPLGVQSLNIGLDEANELALRISGSLQTQLAPTFGAHYGAQRRRQWRRVLGLSDSVAPRPNARDWTERYLGQLMTSLPASGPDLGVLLAQLRASCAPRQFGAN